MNEKRKWLLTALLAVVSAFCFGAASALSAPHGTVRAAEGEISVSDEAALREALENAESARRVTLERDVVLTGKTLTVRGEVTLSGKRLTLSGSGGALGQIAVSAGGELTAEGVTFDQPAAAGPMFYLYGNAKLRLDGCALTGVSESAYRVIQANSANAAVYLNDTEVRCGGSAYPFNRASFVFSGSTFYEGRLPAVSDVNAPYCYDFRGVTVEISPKPDTFRPLDEISLTASNQGTHFKGSGAAQEMRGEIWYTVDGSDPRVSATAERYEQPFRLPVSGTVKAAVRYEGFYQYVPDEQAYELYPDAQPGELERFTALSDLTVSCGERLDAGDFPGIVTVYLTDGREINVVCDWGDVAAMEFYEEATVTLEGSVVLPAFISNPKNLAPRRVIRVEAEEIFDFSCRALDSAQEGKNTVQDGSAVAAFTASGGNNRDYIYTLTDSESYGKDNARFYIDGDKLVVGGEALAAGTYAVHVTVESGGKSQAKAFTFDVQPKAAQLMVSNPYANVDWGAFNQIKTAGHNHTVNTNNNTGWNDNVSDTPNERVEYYRGMGYGCVIITDHDYISYPRSADGSYPQKNMLGIPGAELSKNQHVLSYNCNYYDYESQGPGKKHTYEENIVNVREAGGFIYLAHPCRNDGGGTTHQFWYDIVEKYPWVYGMEVLNAGQFTRNHSEGLWDEILTRNMPYRNLWGTASDDAHSNAAAGTGWAVLLLSEDQMNSEGVANALINGQYYFSSYRVEAGKDDNKRNPGVPAPVISAISVDQANGVISIDAKNYQTVEWISEGGVVVAEGAEINVNDTYGTGKYVRARLKGMGGQTLTQAFALYERDDARFSEAVTVDYDGETLTYDEDRVEADTTGGFNGQAFASGSPLRAGETVYLRGKKGSALEGYAMAVTAARAETPELSAETVTAASVTLSKIGGAEYRLGEQGEWQSSPRFEGLEADTEYVFYARIPAAEGVLKSPEARLTVKTPAQETGSGGETGGCGCGTTLPAKGGGAGLGAVLALFACALCAVLAKRRKHS